MASRVDLRAGFFLFHPTFTLEFTFLPFWYRATGVFSAQIVAGWLCTLFVAGLVAALFTAYGVFTPNKIASQAAVPIVATLNANTATMIQGLNATALSTNNVGLGSSVMVSRWCLRYAAVLVQSMGDSDFLQPSMALSQCQYCCCGQGPELQRQSWPQRLRRCSCC